MGEYKKKLPFHPGPKNWGCKAIAEFCTDTNFQGECKIFNDSQENLRDFGKKSVSARINGTCAWQVFDKVPGYFNPKIVYSLFSILKKRFLVCLTDTPVQCTVGFTPLI